MSSAAQNENHSIDIKKFRAKREMNLGIFLFAIVFIYLAVTVIMYFTGASISVYEVREGSIVNDNSYTGLILRQEEAVNAESGGYISYYQNGNSKVKTGMPVYAISAQKLDTEAVSSAPEAPAEGSAALNSEIQAGIIYQMQSFSENYDPDDFSTVYSLKNEITADLQDAFSTTRTEQLATVIAASSLEVSTYTAPRDGIIAFTVDGLETLTKDTFTADNFDRTAYDGKILEDQMKLSAGSPAYRLITSEDWSVIVQLDRETAEQFKERIAAANGISGESAEAAGEDQSMSIKVRIDKDSETMWADFSVLSRDGAYYGCLDFDNSMIRYAEERYLNIELILEDESGLKIPKSSVIEEKFYVIPEDYITAGGNSSSDGVMVRQEDGDAVFRAVNIYASSEEEVCVSREDLSEGEILIRPESNDTYTVGKTRALKGVYNINKGYAVFKKVEILCENDEYYIVREGDSYGLYNYDHIVQDGTSVKPEEVVFQ